VRTVRNLLNITTKKEKAIAAICSAIKSRRIIEFYYHGGYRTVEPFCLGLVLSGDADNESLICYQVGGFSELREVVGWKLYRASEMEDLAITREQFSGDRPGYDQNNVDMAKIYCSVTPLKKTEDEGEAVTAITPKEDPKVKIAPLPGYPTTEGMPREPVAKYLITRRAEFHGLARG